jgi:hypothetical protein
MRPTAISEDKAVTFRAPESAPSGARGAAPPQAGQLMQSGGNPPPSEAPLGMGSRNDALRRFVEQKQAAAIAKAGSEAAARDQAAARLSANAELTVATLATLERDDAGVQALKDFAANARYHLGDWSRPSGKGMDIAGDIALRPEGFCLRKYVYEKQKDRPGYFGPPPARIGVYVPVTRDALIAAGRVTDLKAIDEALSRLTNALIAFETGRAENCRTGELAKRPEIRQLADAVSSFDSAWALSQSRNV